jgi:hypothetical protein
MEGAAEDQEAPSQVEDLPPVCQEAEDILDLLSGLKGACAVALPVSAMLTPVARARVRTRQDTHTYGGASSFPTPLHVL